jgi:hypothetical protein
VIFGVAKTKRGDDPGGEALVERLLAEAEGCPDVKAPIKSAIVRNWALGRLRLRNLIWIVSNQSLMAG